MSRNRTRHNLFIYALTACLSLFFILFAQAEVPQLVNYQGRLTDDVGNPVPDGDYEITFVIYDAPSDGAVLWTSNPQWVTVVDGLFSYQLGFSETLPDDIFSTDTNRYLGIQVFQEEVQPRTRLISVPFAYHALRADTARFVLFGGLKGSGTKNKVAKFASTDSLTNSVIYDSSDATSIRIGIGTTSPYSEFDIRGVNTDNGALLQLANSDTSHFLRLWPGRSGDPMPFIAWKFGDPFRFATNEGGWSEKMRINSNGDVGIGTTNPLSKLEVAGIVHSTTGGFKFPDGTVQTTASTGTGSGGGWTDGGSIIRLTNSNDSVGVGTATPIQKFEVNGDDLSLRASSSTFDPNLDWIQMRYHSFYGPILEGSETANPIPRLTLDAKIDQPGEDAGYIILGLNGDAVGIGTTNPSYRLEVDGNADISTAISLGNSNKGILQWGTQPVDSSTSLTAGLGRGLWLGTNNSFSDGIYIDTFGNVGIGKTDPTQRLDVEGSVVIRNQLDMDNGSIINLADPANPQDAATKSYVDGFSGLKGPGTAGYIPKYASSDSLANSLISESGGNIGIGVSGAPADELDVNGDIRVRGGNINDFGGTSRIFISNDAQLELKDHQGSTRIYIATDGKVGIWETTPQCELDINGDIALGQYIYHNTDTNTHIEFNLDQIDLVTGSQKMLTAYQGTQSYVNINNGGEDVDFIVKADTVDAALSVYGSNGYVGVGTGTPLYRLEVKGNAAIDEKLIHRGDDDTYLSYTDDQADLYAGNVLMMTADESSTGQDALVLNEDGVDIDFRVESDTVSHALFVRGSDGRVGIGTSAPQEKLDVNGTTRTEVLEITGGSDLAEPFVMKDNTRYSPGTVVVIDKNNPGQLKISDEPYDRKVAGIISGAGGINPGLTLSQLDPDGRGQNVALTGRVWCWADADFGVIEPGDRLTTSATPGHAMKAQDNTRTAGAVIGKAMSSLSEGRGLVLVLVQPQ